MYYLKVSYIVFLKYIYECVVIVCYNIIDDGIISKFGEYFVKYVVYVFVYV